MPIKVGRAGGGLESTADLGLPLLFAPEFASRPHCPIVLGRRDGVHRGTGDGLHGVRTAPTRTPRLQRFEAPAECRECGVVLEDRTRQYCDECLPEYRDTQTASFSDMGRTRLKELRAEGMDLSHTGEAIEKRRSTVHQRRREEKEWEAAHPHAEVDEDVFRTEVLPPQQSPMPPV